MKKSTVLAILLALFCISLIACSQGNTPNTQQPAASASGRSTVDEPSQAVTPPDSEIDNSETRLAMLTNERIGENIAEIPYISYDSSQPALAELGGKNTEIDIINDAIKNGIQQQYNDFMAITDNGGERIEIRCFPFVSKSAIQLVVTDIIFPNYGTDGKMQAYYFDLVRNQLVMVEDVLAAAGLTNGMIENEVKQLYVPERAGMYVGEVEIVGFVVYEDVLRFLLEVTVENPEADSWKHFYEYSYELGTMRQLDPKAPFEKRFLHDITE